MMGETKSALDSIANEVREDFEKHRPIMSFEQFLDAFMASPRRFARNSVQYVQDCFLHFGRTTRREVN